MGLWSGFVELIGLGDGPAVEARPAAAPSAFSEMVGLGAGPSFARPHVPQLNPTTGLAMNEGSLIDVGGNLYGAQLDSGAPDIDWMPVDMGGGFDAFDC